MSGPTIFKKIFVYSIGFIIRFLILKYPAVTENLGKRVEISTPVTAWRKAIEGVHLWKQGVDPYDSDIFHESPLGLVAYNYLLTHYQEWIPVIFAACDVITAVLLSLTAKIYLKKLDKQESDSKFPENANPVLLKAEDLNWVPFYVSVLYLLCPYAVLSCGGKSTVTFQNLILSSFLLVTVSGYWLLAPVFLAILSCHTFYHMFLLVPLVMYTYQSSCGHSKMYDTFKILTIIILTFAFSITLLKSFHDMTGSWSFLSSTYGFILSAPDLTPNIGLFWYFFTEMFEHFRIFFLWTFQLNVFIYVTPLAIRLRKEPMFLLFIYLVIITIFKSYPCIGDVALYFSLLPIWSHLFCFMRQKFIIGCVLASCTLLGPTLWHLWIYSGSANANFYFGITLAFNTGQVFLLTDLLSAFIKREYYLQNGVKYNEDGSLPVMRLQ
ncbi:phosphatidylinositol glycan anchor biosynthesis class U protein [Parasteatoda tepidariorum]|uniref:phosphatidylinositol glycan anchor biosynthesis class U protein n=1 Tax=Parasteatoda tepidariorum TaxID=114398 RepID=UPI00077FA1F2|nr:phosphatidylinositol glycan anchor biosynthesis class U protein [Parasteatoda tepidariorum]